MWTSLAKSTAVVFVACVAVLVAAMEWRNGRVEWGLVLAIATPATALFAVRLYFPLRTDRRRHFIRTELRRRRERVRALGAAYLELIGSMARLSPADLSVYHSILVSTGDGDAACILTSKGSPNHHVLVQMTDLRLATPEEFRTFGAPPDAFTSVRYALTPLGRSYVPRLLSDVRKYRAMQASSQTRPD